MLDRVLRRPLLSRSSPAARCSRSRSRCSTLHTQLPSFTDLPKSLADRRTYDRIQAAFPGSSTPAQVVVQRAGRHGAGGQRAVGELEHRALASGQMKQPVHVEVNPARTVAVVSIPLVGDGDNSTSVAALRGSATT